MLYTIEQSLDELLKDAANYEKRTESEHRELLSQCEKALKLATDNNYLEGKAKALRYKGYHHIGLHQYKEALDVFLQEEKIRRQIGDELEIANALHNIANAYYYLNNLQKAMMVYFEAMQKFETLSDEGLYRSYSNIGLIYIKIGNYAESLNYGLKALKIAEKIGDRDKIAHSYNAVGSVYRKAGDFERALEFHSKSLKLAQEVGSQESIGIAFGSIGIDYHEMKRYEEALEAAYQSKRIFEEIDHTYNLSMAQLMMAVNYEALKMENEALFFYEESLKNAKKSGNLSVESSVLTNRANLLFQRGEKEEALHLLRNALRIAQKAQLKDHSLKIYRLMVDVYRAFGDSESALSAFESFYELEKEIFNEESSRKIRNLQLAFELEQGRREMELEKQKNAELMRLNKELSEANRLKTELLGIAAHDLKNPLQTVLGYAELIMEKVNDLTVQDYAKRIRTSSERMLEMITLLLQDAAITQGKITLNLDKVNLSELCEIVVEFYRSRAEAKLQRIETHIQPNCIIQADRQYVFQILENLISNAIKYSPKEKKISVYLEQFDKVLQFAVKDEGQGLTDEDKAKLFGKFQRLSARPTGNESSTGLGLAIVKELVELHHGKIWAESEGKDKGATFFVQFPSVQHAY